MKRRMFLQVTLAIVACAMSVASLTARAAGVLAKIRRRQRSMILPPLPKWNKATDDIDGADFCRRLLDYERSLLPSNLVFPRPGQIWEAVRDCEVPVLRCVIDPKALRSWPKVELRKGERVRILELDHPKPLQIRFQPLRWQGLQETAASESLRCEMCLRTACIVPVSGQRTEYFSELFRLVEDAA